MQPLFQTIGEYWQALSAFFAFDAALLAEPSMVLRLALLAVLLFCSAFFSSSEANEVLGVNLSDREAHTVGGLVTARLRRIPRIGDNIEEAGFRITVEDASERSALRLKVQPSSQVFDD